jgi:hypothetical protein
MADELVTPAPLSPATGTGVPSNLPQEPAPGTQTDQEKLLGALHEAREEIRQLKDQVSQPQQFTGAPQPQQPANTIQQELDEAWERDPREAVRKELMYGFSWYDQVNTQMDMQRDFLRKKYPDFSKFEMSAMNSVRMLPLNQRSQHGVVEAAYFYHKGQAQEVPAPVQQAPVYDTMKVPQGISGGGMSPVKITGAQPTADEIAVANAMGVAVEEYMKYKR